jgi:hypothetical protein
MQNNHNFAKYKLAKQVCQDLPKVLKVLDLSIKGLGFYKHYASAAGIIVFLKEQQQLIQYQLEKYQKILDKKGLE